MTCLLHVEGQEWACRTCGVRWGFDDERPECQKEGAAPSSWRPSPRAVLAARLRGALAMQSSSSRDPIAVAITPTLARDILAELERTS